jgi:hypothetical protein
MLGRLEDVIQIDERIRREESYNSLVGSGPCPGVQTLPLVGADFDAELPRLDEDFRNSAVLSTPAYPDFPDPVATSCKRFADWMYTVNSFYHVKCRF